MTAVCFVTQELAPFTGGGIGVLIGSLIKHYQSSETQFSVLFCGQEPINSNRFSAVYPKAKLHNSSEMNIGASKHESPPSWAFTTGEWHYKSYVAMAALKELRGRGEKFDVIEFPDWGGLAFCTCQEKLLGNFAEAQLAIRLHSTDTILRPGYVASASERNANLSDIERKSLRDADVIVAHLSTVAVATQRRFGFPDPWMNKVRVNTPPVVDIDVGGESIAFSRGTPLCFTSKIEELKRPEVFLRGALGLIHSEPSYSGDLIFLARPSDTKLEERLRKRVPAELTSRVVFIPEASTAERTGVIGQSIAVFPSPFESFCLAAYEASASGAIVVLNAANPAFGEGTPWQDGINCLKFSGTAASLCDVLKHMLHSNRKLQRISVRAEEKPYWGDLPKPARGVVLSLPKVSVIIPYFNMGAYVHTTIQSVSASEYDNIEIIVVDDGSTDPLSKLVLDRLKAGSSDMLRIVTAPCNLGLSAARNLGIQAATGEFILTLDADDLIHPRFISLAVGALLRNPEYALVVPQTAFFEDSPDPDRREIVDYALFTGEAVSAGLFINRYSTATSLGRKHLYIRFPYDEQLTSYEDWDFYSRLVGAGERFIVTSDIFFYYRRRRGSMINQNSIDRHQRNIDLLRSKRVINDGSVNFSLSVVSDAEAFFISRLKHLGMAIVAESSIANANTAGGPSTKRPGIGSSLMPSFVRWGVVQVQVLLLKRNPSFDSAWYLANYPDVAAAGVNPARHYIMHGQFEGRKPGPSLVDIEDVQ